MKKKYILEYTLGNVKCSFETHEIFLLSQRFEKALDDPNILDRSISIHTVDIIDTNVPVVPVGYEYPFPKHKLFSDIN